MKIIQQYQDIGYKFVVQTQFYIKRCVELVLREKKAQGTTEYAILVGVLVVIAIVAIVAFKGKIQELWTAISDGINSL